MITDDNSTTCFFFADEERLHLKAVANSRSLPHGLVMPPRLILLAPTVGKYGHCQQAGSQPAISFHVAPTLSQNKGCAVAR